LALGADEFEWIDTADDAEYAIEQAARLSHLVVLNTRLPETSPLKMGSLLRTLISRLRPPILAVPPDHRGFNCRGDAVVLWDGSTDAEAALCAATPMLRIARKVTVLQVTEDPAVPPPRKALDYLRSQGISALPGVRASVGEHPSRKIERYFRTSAPDWAVMGGFGHGRIHDNFFGSVTTHLLANTQTPLLLSRHV
jgi:nucleotide-binding universal stress UspA family protein